MKLNIALKEWPISATSSVYSDTPFLNMTLLKGIIIYIALVIRLNCPWSNHRLWNKRSYGVFKQYLSDYQTTSYSPLDLFTKLNMNVENIVFSLIKVFPAGRFMYLRNQLMQHFHLFVSRLYTYKCSRAEFSKIEMPLGTLRSFRTLEENSS